ncbi:Arc-like DNA binding domain-containing protein [Duganella sp. CF517]|uniref:Arc family DNA-binding protein n=1 Tax=Duganella sp. CF517 TaxID=1881038 RepID=UPI0008B4E6B8|nr:Arc family DNA-binding protein [Duganella sp. CF517]SEN31889.1 Arc-like DNA binding domain-containing protein [Duganella sp. CF517]
MTEKFERPPATRQQFVLRFQSEGQRDALKARSQANLRTMNAEILFLIEAGIKATDGARTDEPNQS